MKILRMIFLVLFLASCDQGSSPSEYSIEQDQESFELADAWLNAFEHQDLEKMKSVMSPEVVLHGFGGEDGMRRDSFFEHIEAAGINYSPFSQRKWLPLPTDDALFGGKGILFWGISTMNYEKWGSSSFPIHIVTTVKNGKIVSMHFYYNRLKMFKAAGFKLLPPADEKD